MKANQLKEIFKQLKEVPPELNFATIEKYILYQPIAEFGVKSVYWIKLKYLLTTKNGIIMMTLSTIITSY